MNAVTILKKSPPNYLKIIKLAAILDLKVKKRSTRYVNQKYVFLDKNKVWNYVLCIIVGQTIKKIISQTAILDFGL